MTKGTVVALGFFDGVHIAHQDVLNQAADIARERGLESVALSFDRHPLSLISGAEPPLLCTAAERELFIKKYTGIDRVEILPFDRALMETEPEDFIKMLRERFGAVCVCAGFDYSFGRNGRGNAELLTKVCAELGLDCRIVAARSYEGGKLSSTAIRELILRGDVETAAKLLGRLYGFSGVIRHGKALGRTLGFPTINVPVPRELVLPPAGVYICRVGLEDGEHNAVCNIAHGAEPLCEAHIFNYSADLYGQRATVGLITRLREMRRFESLEKLREQVEKDKKTANDWFIRP